MFTRKKRAKKPKTVKEINTTAKQVEFVKILIKSEKE